MSIAIKAKKTEAQGALTALLSDQLTGFKPQKVLLAACLRTPLELVIVGT